MTSKIKFAPPRPLTESEDSHSLARWKTNFKQFTKKAPEYQHFLKSTTVWNANAVNYGFTANVGDVTPADLKDHIEDFLHLLNSYLPHGFLTDKILKKSTSFDTAFRMIEEHYGVLPTQESFCDFTDITRAPNEPYRQFYDRMLSFVSMHLMPYKAGANNTVDGTAVPATGDKMSVSLMNLVAVMWLNKIHESLLSIVRTEYSKELRDNVAMSELVPRISMSIDALLTKYEKVPPVNKLSVQDVAHGQQNEDHVEINRLRGGGRQNQGFRGRQSGDNARRSDRGQPAASGSDRAFCSGCFYLGRQTNAVINYRHLPAECPRRPALIQLIEAEDADFYPNAEGESHFRSHNTRINASCQESYPVKTKKPDESVQCQQLSSPHLRDFIENKERTSILINRLANSSQVKRIKSPSMWLLINGKTTYCVIDEGSEVTVVDDAFAKEAGIAMNKTDTSAKAAGNNTVHISGQSTHPVMATVANLRVPATLNLGHCLIVKNLGTPILLGQPAKVDHKIVCVPHKHQISLEDIHNVRHTIQYPMNAPNEFYESHVCRAEKTEVMYIGDEISYQLPPKFASVKNVVFSPRTALQQQGWSPSILPVDNDVKIRISNNTDNTTIIKKYDHFADIRPVMSYDSALIAKIYTIDESEIQAFAPRKEGIEKGNFIEDIKLDPDGILDDSWTEKFKNLCTEFSDIIQYVPGTYNGRYGFVRNDVEFTSIPPPNSRCYVPKYSKEMMDTLANKMDELLENGVLRRPEEIGVTPVFTSPSMLVPKPDGDWRLVTDFNQLNTFIRKAPVQSPGIEETKLQLASFKYIVSIDLSQFYFQNSVDRETSQYLGVIHPYKGTLVYTVSPMGLRGSSENSYERLTRMFGDMQRDGKLCRQADALIVGGQDIFPLFSNLRTVFQRLRASNMTIKPSKLEICPAKTTLFGWEYKDQSWMPGPHKINPLVIAEPPTTVKQMRSWLGASKQLSAGLKDYAVVFQPLEALTGGRGSAEKIVWTEDLQSKFMKAKQFLKTMEKIHYPVPDDQIFTYSDFSQDAKAVGGRMEIHRKNDDGSVSILHGGFFSACLSQTRQRWCPCESECLGVKLVLEHFAPMIRESKHEVIHHCDNLPTCLAYARSKQGKFSNSSRIAAFLMTINAMNVKIVHKSGATIKLTDYISRHPVKCDEDRCQICQYVTEQVFIGEGLINQLSVSDVLDGSLPMPYLQVSAWAALQSKDRVISRLKKLIDTGQQPEAKKTGGENRILKNLYREFVKGDLTIAKNGLVTVSGTDDSGTPRKLIVIPTQLFPGLISALHIKMSHPTKHQLGKIVSRYFYCPGSTTFIAECVDNCHTCLSLKPLPETLFTESTTQAEEFCTRFSADVMKRNGQIILFVVELLTQFCWIVLLPSETANDLSSALFKTIGMFVHQNGAIIRTDGAPSFQSIKSQIDNKTSILNQINVKLELGQSHHVNKNPCAEFAIKEGHAAINRCGNQTLLNDNDLLIIARQINDKIRSLGFSSVELFTRRSGVDNSIISKSDTEIADKKLANKLHSHNPPVHLPPEFSKGDLVMIKSDKSKIHPRDTYLVESVIEKNGCYWAELYKFGSKLVNKPQLVKVEDLMKVSKPKRQAATKAAQTIKDLVPYIRAVVHSMVPKHPWDYKGMLQMYRNNDLLYEDEDQLLEDFEDVVSEDIETEDESPENFFSTSENSIESSQNSTEDSQQEEQTESLHSLDSILDNPSIQMYPQQASQVDCNSVQNLAEVFDNIYQERRASDRLAAKPRRDYKAAHNGGNY